MIGYIDTKNTAASSYQPSKDVADFTRLVRDDYAEGVRILERPWTELNDRSVIEDENRGQMMMNAYVDTSVEDPNESWKWRGTRSMARNKGIAMHAQLTSNYLLPLFQAQNENDEIDKGFSEVMQDVTEWMVSQPYSNYKSSFLQVVFGTISSPVTYLGAEWCQVMQTIKEKKEDGSYTTKEVIDKVLSGFQAPIWSATQVLITNAYERNIQKQRGIIKRRYIEYSEAEAKWKDHENWQYVKKGSRSLYCSEDGLFYDVKDDDHPNLIAEETYCARRGDTEVVFLGGVYMGEADVEANPFKHRDTDNAPAYNVTPFGYHRIGTHFAYYKSMMNSLGWDNMLYDAMSEVLMNKAFLDIDMPVAISGTDKVDSDVIFPKAVVAFADKDTRITPLLPQANLASGFNALRETEKSISEGSVSETIAGQLPDASQKAYSVAQARSDAKKMIGAVAKSLAESVMQYGLLMRDIAVNHVTVPDVQELVGGQMKLKYRTFMLAGKQGKARKVVFDDTLVGREMTQQEKEQREMKLLTESGYPKKKDVIRLVNPEMFSKFTYYSKVDVEEMFSRSSEYWQPVLSQLYSQLLNNPFVDTEELTHKLLYAYFQSDAEELMKKQGGLGVDLMQGDKGEQAPTNQYAQQVQGQQLATAAAGMTGVVS